MSVPFGARITEDGVPEFDEPERFSIYLKRFKGQRVLIEVRKVQTNRSIPQNKLLWACYGEIVAQLFYNRPDVVSEDIHEYCKQKFCPTTSIVMPDGTEGKIRSTRKLNTAQMAEYLERVMAQFADYGVEFE